MGRSATIFGATGLVGQALVEKCSTHPAYSRVVRVARRLLPSKNGLEDQICHDLLALPAELVQTDVVFCCLGSTMKRAGSKEAFARVDYEMPMAIGKQLAATNSRGHFVLISAMGADVNSGVYYNKIKGRVENDLGSLPLGRLSIIRPSLLLGERNESRPMEALGVKLAPVLNAMLWGPLKKYRAIAAADVARAMVVCDLSREGSAVYESDQLQIMAQESGSE